VLDAGCGVGAVAALMAELRPDLRFSLLNISAAQLKMAPDSIPKIYGYFQKMPVESGTFDAVMFNYSLGHGLLDACISEAARVLRPGGVLFIYDLTTNDHAHVIPRVGYRPHGRAEVETTAQSHGFTDGLVIENPPSSTDDFCRMFGPGELVQRGLDRTWPIIYRLRKREGGARNRPRGVPGDRRTMGGVPIRARPQGRSGCIVGNTASCVASQEVKIWR
jgi:SAM-dependent methyltransferase